MKTLISFLAATMLIGSVIPSAEAREPVSLDFFYENLESHGNWREVGNYGYVWHPRDVGEDWRPYSDGRWVYTDAGWTWDSNEPFGWAVYHYGRWANVERVGWVWVPGTEWGPGWVSWRHSSRYVGWAPLPPEALFLRAIGFSAWVDDYYDIGPSSYRFVENRNFGAPRLRSVFVDQRQNISIVNQTTNITNITYANNVVYNGGIGYDQQARQSTAPIQRYKLERRQEFEGNLSDPRADQFRSRIEGNSLSVLALPIDSRPAAAPRKFSERVGRAEINRGWNNAGTPTEVAEARARLKSQVKLPDQLPPQAKFEPVAERPAGREPQRPGERLPETAEAASKAKGNREGKPGTADMPPATPEKKPNMADTPPAPADTAKDGKAPTSSTDKPTDSPPPVGRRKMDDPRRPRPGDDTPKGKMEPQTKGRDTEPRPALPIPTPEKPKVNEIPPAPAVREPSGTPLPGMRKNSDEARRPRPGGAPKEKMEPQPALPTPSPEKKPSVKERPPVPAPAPAVREPSGRALPGLRKKTDEAQRPRPDAVPVPRTMPKPSIRDTAPQPAPRTPPQLRPMPRPELPRPAAPAAPKPPAVTTTPPPALAPPVPGRPLPGKERGKGKGE